MPENVSINQDLGIIEVNSYGKVTGKTLDASLKEVINLEKETGINRILVDTTQQTEMPSVMTLYNFANELPRNIRFAIVVSEGQDTKEDQDFFETVARNRGFSVREFTNRTDAIHWLGTGKV